MDVCCDSVGAVAHTDSSNHLILYHANAPTAVHYSTVYWIGDYRDSVYDCDAAIKNLWI